MGAIFEWDLCTYDQWNGLYHVAVLQGTTVMILGNNCCQLLFCFIHMIHCRLTLVISPSCACAQCINFGNTFLTFVHKSSWISERNSLDTLRPL